MSQKKLIKFNESRGLRRRYMFGEEHDQGSAHTTTPRARARGFIKGRSDRRKELQYVYRRGLAGAEKDHVASPPQVRISQVRGRRSRNNGRDRTGGRGDRDQAIGSSRSRW